jgi:hypothetical protein
MTIVQAFEWFERRIGEIRCAHHRGVVVSWHQDEVTWHKQSSLSHSTEIFARDCSLSNDQHGDDTCTEQAVPHKYINVEWEMAAMVAPSKRHTSLGAFFSRMLLFFLATMYELWSAELSFIFTVSVNIMTNSTRYKCTVSTCAMSINRARACHYFFFTYMLQRHAHLFACGMQEQLLD